jgi:hypothetical protein
LEIAKIISELPETCKSTVAKAFADHLKDNNPQFDRMKFLFSCGLFKEH